MSDEIKGVMAFRGKLLYRTYKQTTCEHCGAPATRVIGEGLERTSVCDNTACAAKGVIPDPPFTPGSGTPTGGGSTP
ncbi:MAG: hypothetical protein KIT60_06955 [Burkholderiaceae bacterium]|nr:hypothetical protein [Burkholderiaceae bacterium]